MGWNLRLRDPAATWWVLAAVILLVEFYCFLLVVLMLELVNCAEEVKGL